MCIYIYIYRERDVHRRGVKSDENEGNTAIVHTNNFQTKNL